jgi:serine kinase
MSKRMSSKKLSERKLLSTSPSQEHVLRKRGYSIGDRIGEGSYAQVYKAAFSDPKKTNFHEIKLACKIIDCRQISKKFSQKFLPREVEILGKINHPNIIRVHSILQKRDNYYIFMEYADQGDLLAFILDHGAVKERQAQKWFTQILKGLKYLHDQDIAHRDMKCENILLTSTFNIKISDFGFARFIAYEKGQPVSSTTYCGSITYAPPEIVKGVPYNPKLCDIWSIGVILYIMLNKSWPFDPSSATALYEAQMGRKWKIRSKMEGVLSPAIKDFLRILLEPIPEKRKTTHQLLLNPWVAEEPFTSSLVMYPKPVPPQPKVTTEPLPSESVASSSSLTGSSDLTKIGKKQLAVSRITLPGPSKKLSKGVSISVHSSQTDS